MTVILRKKRQQVKWLRKVYTASLLFAGTTVAVFPRVLSNVAFPKDGTIVHIPYEETKFNETTEEIFYISGIIRDASNEKLAQRIAEGTKHPIVLVYNGSSCKDSHSQCWKFWDYVKGGLNRVNNLWTGRGNEPIIRGMKEALVPSLMAEKPIIIIAHSEGALIAAEAIKDLHGLNKFNLRKTRLVLMGSPLHRKEFVKIKTIVGEVKDFSHPKDIITCLQQDVFRFPDITDRANWFIINPEFKKCVSTGSIKYHGEDIYRLPKYLGERK